MMKGPDVEEGKEDKEEESSSHLTPPLNQDTPTTPMPPDVDDIDDEFNLPISLAFFLLLAYIFCGAAVYTIWEDWSFFEACYFVFISMYLFHPFILNANFSKQNILLTGPQSDLEIMYRIIPRLW